RPRRGRLRPASRRCCCRRRSRRPGHCAVRAAYRAPVRRLVGHGSGRVFGSWGTQTRTSTDSVVGLADPSGNRWTFVRDSRWSDAADDGCHETLGLSEEEDELTIDVLEVVERGCVDELEG